MSPRARLFALLALLAWGAAAQDPAPPIRAFLASCERFGFSGSVLVAKRGKVLVADGFGLADRDKKVRNTKDTLFEIASATKSFTAVAILQLEMDGKLALEDPISKHLPGVPAGFDDVTIASLLHHTSGMPRSATGGAGDDLERAVAGYLAAKRPRKAGAAYEYWNGGFALLAGIVERASGASYMDWCRKRIFEPAGMTSSGFTGDAALDTARIAIGYEGDAAPRRADEHPYNASYGWHYRGMGGLVTTVDDLFRFDRALRDDTLLSAKARSKLLTPALENYGCGFYVIEKPVRRNGHGGDVRGFHCQFFRYPDQDGCIAVLCNCGGVPTWAIEENLRALAFGASSRYPKPPATADWPKDKLEALAGVYEAAPGERVVVKTGDGILLGAEGPEMTRLLGASVFGPPRVPDPILVQSANTMIKRLAEGDVEPIRKRIGGHIPESWPDSVKSTIWPKRIEGLGCLEGIRTAGASAEGESTTVLLALDFERGSVRLKVIFAGDRLRIFDLNGPEFLAEARAAPAPDGRLLRFTWQGEQPSPIAVLRDASGRPTGLRFEGAGANPVYKRVAVK